MAKNKLIMIFLDGVGIGKKDFKFNPFLKNNYLFFKELFGSFPTKGQPTISKKYLSTFPINARMGISGLPQSGTGQVSIFCGVNAQKIIGKHFGPYVYSTLLPILNEKNIFRLLKNKNKKGYFANAYPRQFFEYINSGKRKLTATTLSYLSAGNKLCGLQELHRRRAITAEITGEIWNEKLGYKLKIRSPFESGEIFHELAQENDYTLFEYFLTDHAGHSQDFDFAHNVISKLEIFLSGFLHKFNYDKESLLIVSDHGNLEDLSIKTHTLNPALGVAIGKGHRHFAERIESLDNIKSAILSYLEVN
ncbi:MAG: metalloenzyme [Ignavibacteria bacterium]|nr:metalloenzyme [Ignavibacteria bacterium]